LQEVYSALARKEEANKHLERKFSALLHEKEGENIKLRMKVDQLAAAKEEELAKITNLEKEMRITLQSETDRFN